MIITTTPMIEGSPVREYKGIVTSEVIIGANAFRDLFASIRDVFGGRSSSYEKVFAKARNNAMDEIKEQAEQLGANAIVGVKVDYETVGESNSMLMVICCGTAVLV
ncbi:heavy metal-binding domain-containing protein [Prevotella sp.]|uniref:heavy metal-binding domain-containing protein n=1 Tax=uncultured Prevotella sp. TaxID=159272 RepID=UPI0025D63CD1|nr:heavy metal-binding domain-containing protein [Prevotella sp.]